MKIEQRILKWILLLSGLFLMTAFATAFLPLRSMAAIHRWLGLGQFPNAPITLYLARSTSLLYGVHGTLMFYTGMTIVEHWRFVRIFGWLHILMGTAMVLIDYTSGLPMYWILGEGVPVVILGCLILILQIRVGIFEKAGSNGV